VAAVAGTFSAIANNTRDFKQRLKPPSPAEKAYLEQVPKHSSESASPEIKAGELSSAQLEALAWRMAGKTIDPDLSENLNKPGTSQRMARLRRQMVAKRVKGGRAHQIADAVGHYGCGLVVTGAKAPVAFFYNVANGFRNLPSYMITNEVHRRRDEITGLPSGLAVAGKEFVFNIGEAFGGLVYHPYVGAKVEGPVGFAKGIPRGIGGFGCHLLAGERVEIRLFMQD